MNNKFSPSSNSAIAGGLEGASNPLYLAAMQASQPDILTGHKGAFNAPPRLPASPAGAVQNGGPMPPVAPPQTGGATGSWGAQSPQAPSWMNPDTLFGGLGGGSSAGFNPPMPRPRPTPGPSGPTSVGGAPLGFQGPMSVGGAPLQGQQGVTPQPAQGGGPQFNLATGTWDYPSGQQNGSSLIAKMMDLLHGKANSGSIGTLYGGASSSSGDDD
jgi:hypothetical protein